MIHSIPPSALPAPQGSTSPAQIQITAPWPRGVCFQNQMGSLLDEELALLRGVEYVRAACLQSPVLELYQGRRRSRLRHELQHQGCNQDGFIDENDARVLYPQGHGDAWNDIT